MRKIIALKDEFYNRYIIKGNLFAPVIDAFVRNNGRYNLLDSAILEMFEFIKLVSLRFILCSICRTLCILAMASMKCLQVKKNANRILFACTYWSKNEKLL
jgi:hypothetical protein